MTLSTVRFKGPVQIRPVNPLVSWHSLVIASRPHRDCSDLSNKNRRVLR